MYIGLYEVQTANIFTKGPILNDANKIITISNSVEINTMVNQFRIFKEMENKLNEKLFDFSNNPS